MKFPRYRYADMVRLQHRLVTEQFGLTRLRLVMGTSMGEMRAWMWGYMFPSFADGLAPLARSPAATACGASCWSTRSSPIPPGRTATTLRRRAADTWLADQIAARLKTTDANDTIDHFRASDDYGPSAQLAEVTAPLLAINSADDFVNPPELPMMRALIGKVAKGKFVLVQVSDETRGHGTHSRPRAFGPHLAEFLKGLGK